MWRKLLGPAVRVVTHQSGDRVNSLVSWENDCETYQQNSATSISEKN
jgi:hypothetical protein